jgi:mRNA interferase RelE/StbE
MFSTEIEKQALKFLERLKDKQLRRRLTDKIDELEQNPFPRDCKLVEGHDQKIYRVRVGNYRILYYVVFETRMIYVFIIDKRGTVYK